MGVNVQKEICDDGCSFRTTCGFQRQRTALQDDPVGLFFMASDYLWLPCPAPEADLAIVDESVIDKAKRVGWREYGIFVVAEEGARLTWPEWELIRQLGTKLYGKRKEDVQ